MKYIARTPRQSLSVDGFRRIPIAAAAMPQPILASARPTTKKPTLGTAKKRRRLPFWLQILLLTPLVMFAALFIQSGAMGQIAIVGYGIAAFVWRVPSRTSFTMALMSFITTTVLLIVQGNLPLAQNFATYTFLLLVVGVFTLSRELKQEGGRIYSSRYTHR